jgi:short-subunit dehydrogenase involved in D-alanine esterification of teichoic acids
MKISITGHSKGIGKSLSECFSTAGHTIFGFSRSSGFDISVEESRQQILEMSNDSDVFINNAYDPVGQFLLLQDMIQQWQGLDKMIINISSKLSYLDAAKSKHGDYILAKQKQNSLIKDHILKGSPKILNVIVGLVDTDMSTIFNARKIDPFNLAGLILTIVNQKDLIAVQEMVVDVPNLNWNDIRRV